MVLDTKTEEKKGYNHAQDVKITIKSKVAVKDKKGEETAITSDKKPKKKRKLLKSFIFLFLFFAIAFTAFSSQILLSDQKSSSWFNALPIVGQIKNIAESANRELKGESRGRINILLLGIGGKNHSGGTLTDTIMIASIDTETKKIALTSIPRDLYVPIENMGWGKINAINAYAEKDQVGSGGLAISQAISDLLNIPIDYYVRVDFAGFVNIVNELGKINVYVENTLDDYNYPVLGNEDANWNTRWEHLHVDKGWQEMDGDLALKFARSRHGVGSEGSDFARAHRQQQIMTAVKEKLLSVNTLLNPGKITGIINQYQDHVGTNLQIWEMLKLWDLVKGINKENIISKVIDNGPNGLLVSDMTEGGAYILKPRSGDFTEIQYFVNNVFSDAPKEDKTQVNKERATVEVRNGTWLNGLASQKSTDLEKYGFTIVRVGNSSHQNFEKTVIYDLTYGEKAESLQILKTKTNANVSNELPEWLVTDINEESKLDKNPVKPDFILILGQDADASDSGTANKEQGGKIDTLN